MLFSTRLLKREMLRAPAIDNTSTRIISFSLPLWLHLSSRVQVQFFGDYHQDSNIVLFKSVGGARAKHVNSKYGVHQCTSLCEDTSL